MSLFSPSTEQMFSFLTQRQRLGWRFCNADVNSQLTIPEAWKGSGLGNQNLQWKEKLNHRLPQGELTLALLNPSGGLGKEMMEPGSEPALPVTAPPFWNRGPWAFVLQNGMVLQHS